MTQVAQRYQARLSDIKKNVKEVYEAWKPNYDRFNDFRRFVFESSLTPDEISLLQTQGKPQLEFPMLPAYISRLMGEFSKQEPSIQVSSANQKLASPQIVNLIDQHLRHVMFDSANKHVKWEVYKDLLSGGFSVFKLYTDYENLMSVDQVIKWDRVYDPTLCGFDLLARYSHKGDGRFCFELFPKSKESFEEEWPDVDISKLNFRRDFAGFNWSYLNGKTPTLLVAEYYEKKKKEFKVVKVRDGRTMTLDKYEEMLSTWSSLSPPPAIIGKPVTKSRDIICRYICIDDQVLEYTETDFSIFPLIFVDGDSINLKLTKNGTNRQFIKPYVYHAKGAQRLKNYAGISLANEIENIVQHKFMVAKEALPKEEEFLESYKDITKANVVVFNSVYEQDPNFPINNPIREIQRAPAPPEIIQGFNTMDSMTQMILGSYDASLGINDNQLSGVAVVEAATQSNAAAMPYIVGFMQGLQRVAEGIVSLIPKYWVTPRSMPIRDSEGKKSFVDIENPNGLKDAYDDSVMNVQLEAGPSFQVQKSKNMNQLNNAMKANPQFAQFFAEKGLKIYVANMEMEGIDELKTLADEWMQEQAQVKHQMMQQANQPNPAMMKFQLEQQKLQEETKKTMINAQLESSQQQIDKEKINVQLKDIEANERIEKMRAEAELSSKRDELELSHIEHAKDHHIKSYDALHKHGVAWHNAIKPMDHKTYK